VVTSIFCFFSRLNCPIRLTELSTELWITLGM
jgi:hypothetical protein